MTIEKEGERDETVRYDTTNRHGEAKVMQCVIAAVPID